MADIYNRLGDVFNDGAGEAKYKMQEDAISLLGAWATWPVAKTVIGNQQPPEANPEGELSKLVPADLPPYIGSVSLHEPDNHTFPLAA